MPSTQKKRRRWGSAPTYAPLTGLDLVAKPVDEEIINFSPHWTAAQTALMADIRLLDVCGDGQDYAQGITADGGHLWFTIPVDLLRALFNISHTSDLEHALLGLSRAGVVTLCTHESVEHGQFATYHLIVHRDPLFSAWTAFPTAPLAALRAFVLMHFRDLWEDWKAEHYGKE